MLSYLGCTRLVTKSLKLDFLGEGEITEVLKWYSGSQRIHKG